MLTFVAVVLFKSTTHSRIISASIAALIFISFFISGGYYISDYITGRGIDESVFFHLAIDTTGAGLEEFSIVIIGAIFYLVSIAVISVITYQIVRTNYKVKRHKLKIAVGILSLFIAFFVNPGAADIKRIYFDLPFHQASANSELYLSLKNQDQKITKNLVYIYLESFERTYLDEKLFPGLAPNLKRLEQEALSFVDIRQTYGSGWTIAGVVASQCAIPLVTPSHGNSMSGMDSFLPRAKCLGDILSNNGYDLNYVGGASLDFAGKGNFYRTHGFNRVEGFDELNDGMKDPSYRSSWGLFDDSLFEVLKTKYDYLSSREKPFGLFGLTLDTHHPDGYESNYCKQWKYRDGSNPILNSVHCADKMVSDLVDHIKSSKQYENTLLVLASDHLAMRNTAWRQLEKGNRKNLFLVMGKNLTPAYIDKPGSTLDISPTLLHLMGANIEGFAYGRNMMGEGQTLTEKVNNFYGFLKSSRTFLKTFWGFPQITQGLEINLEQKKVQLEGQSVSYPALLVFDEKNNVQDIRFEFYSPTSLLDQIAKFSRVQKFLWIDECSKTRLFGHGVEKAIFGDLCLLIASQGAKKVFHTPLVQNTFLSFDEIKGHLEKTEYDKALASDRAITLAKASENLKKVGRAILNEEAYKPQKSLTGNYSILSVGGFVGQSSLVNSTSGIRTSVSRGLTLLGINSTGEPIQIRHLDRCGKLIEQLPSANYSFQDDIDRWHSNFGAFVILSHDSAVCETVNLAQLFERTGLKEWGRIGFRAPYIAIISGIGETREFLGQRDTAVSVESKDFISPYKLRVPQRKLKNLFAVAHAGGGYKGKAYTDSIEALEHNSKFYRNFEIDFSWTSDSNLVCLHDWDESFKSSFNLQQSGKRTLSDFLRLVKTRSKVENCTLQSLADWLKKNKHAYIVTDIKEDNIRALEKIAKEYPSLQNRFIPQVYQPIEYYQAKALGFKDIIWTLYTYGGSDQSVLSHIDNMDLLALTMPRDRADKGLAKLAYDRTGVLSYVHTVNDQSEMNKYLALGVNQIYTDFLPQPVYRLFSLRSAGGLSLGGSYVNSGPLSQEVHALRGLTLVGLSVFDGPQKLAHIDSCGAGEVKDVVGLKTDFHSEISRFKGKFNAFVILGADSVVCGNKDLQVLFKGLPFTKWKELSFREPYFGVLFSNGNFKEVRGAGDSFIADQVSVTNVVDWE
jgi:hypothetical protein